MPPRTRKPCRNRACRALTRNKSGYCDEHQSESCGWVRSNGTKQGGGARGYGWKWSALRKNILARDNFLCQSCLKKGIAIEAKHVDHIKPKHLGGTDEPSNLQSLCAACHKKKTASESRAARSTVRGAGKIATD